MSTPKGCTQLSTREDERHDFPIAIEVSTAESIDRVGLGVHPVEPWAGVVVCDLPPGKAQRSYQLLIRLSRGVASGRDVAQGRDVASGHEVAAQSIADCMTSSLFTVYVTAARLALQHIGPGV